MLNIFYSYISIRIYSQKDTVFIKKNSHQKVYIEKNKNSDYYKEIINFKGFEANCSAEKIKNLGIADKWIRLHKYKGQYVLYAPCDWINDTKVIIDDSKIQFKGGEIVSFKVKSIKMKDENIIVKYKIPFLKKSSFLTIAPIDKEKGIYQFTEDNGKRQYIMLEADRYQNFDILVNECTNNKVQEFEFGK